MRGGRRMDHQALGIADIGQVREQLQSFDEAAAGFEAAADSERKNASGAAAEDSVAPEPDNGWMAVRDS